MRTIAVVLGLLPVAMGIGACGGSTKTGDTATEVQTRSTTTSPAVSTTAVMSTPPPMPRGAYLNDGDKDPENERGGRHENGGYRDSDDDTLLSMYGNASAPAVRAAVTKLVDRYYRAIAQDNSVVACSLMVPTLMNVVPVAAGKLGPTYLHGAKTCRQFIGKLSRHFRSQLRDPVVVTGVRDKGAVAVAELGSKLLPAGWITVHNEHGTWRIAQLFGAELA